MRPRIPIILTLVAWLLATVLTDGTAEDLSRSDPERIPLLPKRATSIQLVPLRPPQAAPAL